jgi:hypothetical protein
VVYEILSQCFASMCFSNAIAAFHHLLNQLTSQAASNTMLFSIVPANIANLYIPTCEAVMMVFNEYVKPVLDTTGCAMLQLGTEAVAVLT